MRAPFARSGLIVPAAAALLAAGCGGAAPARDGVDVNRLEQELATVIKIQERADGYDYARGVGARCDATAVPLHFACQVYAILEDKRVNSWQELVDCDPPHNATRFRCFSASGFALQ